MNKQERLKLDGVAEEPILFYGPNNAFGVFSNFSKHGVFLPHPFTNEWVSYLTTEHRYQAMKAATCEEHDYVWRSSSPGQSKIRGREISLRDAWGDNYGDICWDVMVEAITAKTYQHPAMIAALKTTGTRHIYEDSPTDDIWGWRYRNAYSGKNLLGRALMEVRGAIL